MCDDLWNFGGVSGEDWGVFRKKPDIESDIFFKNPEKSIFLVSFWLLTIRIARHVYWSPTKTLITLSAIGDVLRGSADGLEERKIASLSQPL